MGGVTDYMAKKSEDSDLWDNRLQIFFRNQGNRLVSVSGKTIQGLKLLASSKSIWA